MFIFSGTFFPVSQLPDLVEWIAYLTPLWHGVALSRAIAIDAVDPVARARQPHRAGRRSRSSASLRRSGRSREQLTE